MFNPHNNVTADGVLITEGLTVFTNELEIGTVRSDDAGSGVMCCFPNGSEHDKPTGQMYQAREPRGWFSDHVKAGEAKANGCYCGHDHWFTVSTRLGTKSFNGERLSTVFEGKKAE